MRALALSLVLALPSLGCLPPNRPDDLGDWDACAVRATALEIEAGDPPRAKIAAGADQVLVVHSKWGGGGMIAVEHFWGELLVVLPATLHAGQALEFEAETPPTRAQYREGHSITSYQSGHVSGRVTILEVTEREVALAIELRSAAPVVDYEQRGAHRLRGRVVADREESLRDCF